MYGYFSAPEQENPEFDPGTDIECPICYRPLKLAPMKTISLMAFGDNRSYFYRAHKACYEASSEGQRTSLESSIIDAIAYGNNKN